MTGLRTAPAAILLLATLVAAAIFTAAPPISGAEPRETVILPTITISATGGVTTVTEGTDLSFTITATPPPARPLEIRIYLTAHGDFTDIPPPGRERQIIGPESYRFVTVPARSNPDQQFTTAVLLVATNDDDHDEENGRVHASLRARLGLYTVSDQPGPNMQVEDNDITLPPERMHPPTVLPANGRLEIFWEEPPPPDAASTPTQGKAITKYLITGAGSFFIAGNRTITVRVGHQRHLSTSGGVINGQSYNVQIQACRANVFCSALSDVVAVTPTASGPAITSRPDSVVSLPEEIGAPVGEFSAVSTTPGAITWRLGGIGSDNFSQTVSGGTMTLALNAGVSYESLTSYGLTVVATDSSTDRASNSTMIRVNITDVDETPTFAESSIVRPTYVVGERIETFALPAARADERPITYKMLTEDLVTGLDLPPERKLPPGLSLFGTFLIYGTPTQAGSYTATYAATDRDGDVGTLSVEFTVVAANLPPTVAIQIADQDMTPTDSPRAIELNDKFEDPDTGDTLTYTAASGNTGVVTAAVTGSTLTLTPVAVGTTTITVTATDPAGLSAFQELTVTVEEQSLTFGGMTYTPPTLYLDAHATVVLPEATGGSGILTYTLTNPPTGMTFDPMTRELSGTPSVAGTFAMTYTAKDENAAVAAMTIEIIVEAKLVPVTGFNVVPLPAEPTGRPTDPAMRRAQITWQPSANKSADTVYDLYYEDDAGTRPATGLPIAVMDPVKGHIVSLDELKVGGSREEGLRGSDYFKFWVVTRDPTGVKSDSEESERIIITESPIIEVNGNSEGHSQGRALVKWTPQGDIIEYNLRWKILGHDAAGNQHDSLEWVLDSHSLPLPYPGQMIINNSSVVSATIDPLLLDIVYAVNLVYTRSIGGVREQVFSARDRFVYPSMDKQGGGNRIATIPLRAQLPDANYRYIFCKDNFPEPHHLWERFVNHAFQQWRIATNDLVTFSRITEINGEEAKCTDFSEHINEVADNVEATIAVHGDVGGVLTPTQIEKLVTDVLERFDEFKTETTRGKDKKYSEVEVIDDVNIPRAWLTARTFLNIASTVAAQCQPTCTVSGAVDPTGDKATSDILLLRSDLDDYLKIYGTDVVALLTPSLFPGGDINATGEDDQFNSCLETTLTYRELIHEAGHALGLGGGKTGMGQDAGHPNNEVSESAMSYGVQHSCFPHPLDVMAMYAIYQNRDVR